MKSFNKALDVLEVMKSGPQGAGLAELSRRLRLPRSTTHRLLSALVSRGYVRKDPSTGRYWLGIKLWELGCASVTQLGMRDVARPILEDLGAKTREIINLTILDDGEVVYIDMVDSSLAVRPASYPGRRGPAYCTAAGKAMLAFAPAPVLATVLRKGLRRFTPRTITSPTRLRRELAKVRVQGYAVNLGEWRPDVQAVASPVFGHLGLAAAVSITYPAARYTPGRLDEFAALVRKAGKELSVQLGCLEFPGPARP